MLAGWPGWAPSNKPNAGKIRRNSFSKSLSAGKAHSAGVQVTMASMLV
jgi:hypothetical protein